VQIRVFSGALCRNRDGRGRAPDAAAGGIGQRRGKAAPLMRFASRNAWRARAQFLPEWEMRAARRAQRAAGEGRRKCGQTAFREV